MCKFSIFHPMIVFTSKDIRYRQVYLFKTIVIDTFLYLIYLIYLVQ